jgi:hypothetical protein
MTRAYCLNGLKLESDFELTALAPWDGPDAAPADVVFRLGKVPPRLDRPDHIAAIFQARAPSEYLLSLPGTGRILVRDGNEVTFEPEAGADATCISAMLTSPIQAVLWHQRGLLPLHASVVVVGDRAVALCGHSAAGKSALAALLAARGHCVAADDVCVVDARDGAGASVFPGNARLRLWRDTLDDLGVPTRGLVPALSGKDKYFLDCGDCVPHAPQRLAALVILSRKVNGGVGVERLRGVLANAALQGVVHMRRPARALGRDPDIFAAVARLANHPVWRLTLSEGLACLHDAAAKVLTALEA